MTTIFQQTTLTNSLYVWSNVANWTNGVPVDGASVVDALTGYDDIAALSLTSLTLNGSGIVDVIGSSLDVTTVTGNSNSTLLADAVTAAAPVSVTVGSITGLGGTYEAFGTGAVFDDLSATDPGESYVVGSGGLIELAATPSSNSNLQYFGAGGAGTFALESLGASNDFGLVNVRAGDVLELPGSSVISGFVGNTNLAITTNDGTYAFNFVNYANGPLPGYSAAYDPSTGLEAITFLAAETFQRIAAVASGPLIGNYLWSNAANWMLGAPPPDGDAVVAPVSGLDDIAALSLTSLTLNGNGFVYVIGSSLNVTNVASNNKSALVADAVTAAAPVSVTVDSITGAGGVYQAIGAGAVFVDQSAIDFSESYSVGSGGLLELAATPATSSDLQYNGAGTFALENPGASNTVLLLNVAAGDVLELPGSSVGSVSVGTTSLSVTTNDGTYAFSNVNYANGPLAGYSAAYDATTGLEAITLLAPDSFQQVSAPIIGPLSGDYLWSLATNWTNGEPTNGSAAIVNIPSNFNPGSYDDIANLELSELDLQQGFVAVAGTLTVDNLVAGSGILGIEADTLQQPGISARLTINAITGDGAFIRADGFDAVTVVNATDTGNAYGVAGRGFLELTGAISPNSVIDFPDFSTDDGTLALGDPQSTVAAGLDGLGIGDALELPGSSVAMVTFDTVDGILTVVTNLATTTFNNVKYQSDDILSGYSAAVDPSTGLEEITLQGVMTDAFQQTVTATVDGTGVYLWSDPNNWTSNVPTNGTLVSVGIGASPNPGSYDDLSNLEVSQLYLDAGYVAVAGTLTVDNLNLTNATGNQGLASDTLIDNAAAAALLTIDGIVGSGAYIDADGTNAETVVNATDTGNTYDVAGGGLVELTTPPNADSAFVYPSDPVDSGTFAFSDAGSTMSGSLQNVGPGDSVELPGASILTANFDTVDGLLTVTTDLGTTTFNNVGYQLDLVVTGYTAAADLATGLEKVTLNGYETTNFLQTVAYHVTYNGSHFELFTWSNDNNWDNGLPTDGGHVTIDVTSGASPQSYDDIADLSLAALNLVAGSVAVGLAYDSADGATLDIAGLGFGPSSASIFSDTEIGAPSATLTIDGFTGSNIGIIGAFGAGAFTEIDATADPGEHYRVDQGGELLLDPTPNSSPGTTGEVFAFENTGTASGTFAFQNPGGTIDAPLTGVAAGDSIALPGDQVDSVTYGASSIAIVTNLGTTTFDNVDYSALPSGWTAQPDAVSGLVDATFGNTQATQFKQTQASYEYGGTSNDFGIFLWSVLANWTDGIPTDGAAVTVLAPAGAFPTSVDDIDRALPSLYEYYGGLMVAATLEVGILTFGTAHPLIYADSELIGNPATLTIDNIAGTNYGTIAAIGTGAFTGVLTPTDPGETYQVGDSAELELAPTPNAAPANPLAVFEYLVPPNSQGIASGTFAFVNPGSTVGALLADAEIGNSVALPGDFASSVTYGPTTLTVVTNVGTTVFDNVTYYPGDVFSGYIQSLDPVSGLVRVTFEGSVPESFLQTDATGIGPTGGGQFLWSNANNWTDGIPLADSVATFDIPSSPGAPGGYDDIASLVLNQLNIPVGYDAVGGALEIDTIAASGTFSAGIEADTSIDGGSATITVDAFTTASHMLIGATGINAIARVDAATDPGEIYQASDGGLVVLQPTPNPSSQFDLNLGDATSDTGTIAFQDPGATVAALLGDVGVGDAIELPGASVTSVTYAAESLTVVTNLGTTIFSDVTYLSSVLSGAPTPTHDAASADPTTGLEKITFVACYAAGTHILTAQGEVPIEAIRVGDTVRVVLGDGLAPVIWVGRREVDCRRHTQPRKVWPVRVAAGAFGPGRPHTDVLLSPDHAVFVNQVLIPIKHLTNGSTIEQVQVNCVTYHHIELAQHDVLLAEGLPAESFLAMRDAPNYANRPGPVRLYPDFSAHLWEAFGCARLIVTGPELDAARALVARFAMAREAA